jgi:hypothetical protein
VACRLATDKPRRAIRLNPVSSMSRRWPSPLTSRAGGIHDDKHEYRATLVKELLTSAPKELLT